MCIYFFICIQTGLKKVAFLSKHHAVRLRKKTAPCCRHVILRKTLVGPFVGMCNFIVKATSSLRLFHHLEEPHVYDSQKGHSDVDLGGDILISWHV